MSGIGQLVSSGPLLLAMPVAAAAGAVTFLSPCCLPLVPGYLSFVTGMAGVAGATGGPTSPTEADEPGTAGLPAMADGSGVAVAARPVAVPASPPRARVVAGTALFVLGFSIVFVAYGAALGGLGHRLAMLSASLFAEPNPAVIKAVLHEHGEIASPAVRLPLLPASRDSPLAALNQAATAGYAAGLVG